MSLDIFAKALAPALGFEKSKIDQYIHKLLELAIEELLIQGEVKFAGIGMLKRVYHPAEPREKEPGKLYLYPPSQSIELVTNKEFDSGDFIYDAAIGQFQMSEENALRFSKGFALSIEKSIDVRGKLELGVLGTFEKENDHITFKQSPQLTELLQKPYNHLEPTELNQAAESELKKPDAISPVEPKAASGAEPVKPEQPKEPQIPAVPKEPEVQPAQVKSTPPPSSEPVTESQAQPESHPPGNENPDLNWLYKEETDSHKKFYYIIGAGVVLIVLLAGVYWYLTSGDKPSQVAESPKEPVEQVATDSTDIANEQTVAGNTPPEVPQQKSVSKTQKTSSVKSPSRSRTSSSAQPSDNNSPWFVPPALTQSIDFTKRGYSISVASFPDKLKADKLANTYSKKGFAVTVWQADVKGTSYYRVLIGSFSSRSKALNAKNEAGDVLPKDAFIVKVN